MRSAECQKLHSDVYVPIYHILNIYDTYHTCEKACFESTFPTGDTKQVMNHYWFVYFYRCVGRSLMCKIAVSSQIQFADVKERVKNIIISTVKYNNGTTSRRLVIEDQSETIKSGEP